MSNDTSNSTIPAGLLGGGNEAAGGFTYGVGISVGVLLLISTITLTSYCCTRSDHRQSINEAHSLRLRRARNGNEDGNQQSHCVVEIGIDEATLMSYPKMVYLSKAAEEEEKSGVCEEDRESSTATCCSICLAEYKSGDLLRLLPDCGHMFHLGCVDPWLRINVSCPVCRMLPTPHAEVGAAG